MKPHMPMQENNLRKVPQVGIRARALAGGLPIA